MSHFSQEGEGGTEHNFGASFQPTISPEVGVKTAQIRPVLEKWQPEVQTSDGNFTLSCRSLEKGEIPFSHSTPALPVDKSQPVLVHGDRGTWATDPLAQSCKCLTGRHFNNARVVRFILFLPQTFLTDQSCASLRVLTQTALVSFRTLFLELSIGRPSRGWSLLSGSRLAIYLASGSITEVTTSVINCCHRTHA